MLAEFFAEIDPLVWVGLVFVLGWTGRITWRYLLAYYQKGVSFDTRMIVGSILIGVPTLIGLLTTEYIAQLQVAGLLAALLAGFGTASVGRGVQKTYDVVRGK